MTEGPWSDLDLSESRQWAIKKVAGRLMIAAGGLVILVTALYDARGVPYPPATRTTNYSLSPLVVVAGVYLLLTKRRLPLWLAYAVPSIAAVLICLPTSTREPSEVLSPLLLTWPVAFAGAVLPARVAWTTTAVAAAAFAVLAAVNHRADGLVAWIETAAALTVVCWMVVRVQNESLRLRAALASLARTDPLTGLLNRRGFDEAVAREHANSRLGERSSALLLVDIDHFKLVNDTWGHQAGDDTLRLLGALLGGSFRAGDAVGRFGGEEFAVLLVNCAPAEAAERARDLCERVRTRSRDWEHPITVSVGAATTLKNPVTPDRLMATADNALYAAKAAGRDRVWTEPVMPGEPENPEQPE